MDEVTDELKLAHAQLRQTAYKLEVSLDVEARQKEQIAALQRDNATLKGAVDVFRSVLITYGRKQGCLLADDVSNEFLAHVPGELSTRCDDLKGTFAQQSQQWDVEAKELRDKCEALKRQTEEFVTARRASQCPECSKGVLLFKNSLGYWTHHENRNYCNNHWLYEFYVNWQSIAARAAEQENGNG